MAKDIPLSGITDPSHERYKEAAEVRGLIDSELQALSTQSQIIAAALGEAAVSVADPDDEERDDRLALLVEGRLAAIGPRDRA
jgi:hypothetical protein